MTEPVIELDGVEKAYRFFRLSDVALRLEAGQIMGFVGPNGAGKSTTIRILMGMIRQDRGTVRVLGRRMPDEQAVAKRDIGFVSEDMRLYERGDARLAHGVHRVDLPGLGCSVRRHAARALQPARGADDQGAVARRAGEGDAAARRSRAGRGCCCSTSRRPGSTRWRGTRSSPS